MCCAASDGAAPARLDLTQPLGVDQSRALLLRSADATMPVTVREPSITFDLTRTTLAVIDMQNDVRYAEGWCAGIGMDMAPARRMIAPLRRLRPALRHAGVSLIGVTCGTCQHQRNLDPADAS